MPELSSDLIASTLKTMETIEVEQNNLIATATDDGVRAGHFAVWLDRARAALKPLVAALKAEGR